MSDDLVERVTRALDTWVDPEKVRAAIAVALEEAAKEASCWPHQFKIVGAPWGSFEIIDSHKEIAAAIRALKDK